MSKTGRVPWLACICLAAQIATCADVTILWPTNGAVFPAYSTVTIEVQPDFKDGDNSIRYGVEGNEYISGENMIAVVRTPPYSLTLSNLPAGTHRYAAWSSDASPRAYVEIIVTNPPVHTGAYSMVEVIGDSLGTGMNNHGVIVVNTGHRGYTWDNGVYRRVPMPNRTNESIAMAINDAGQITGGFYNTNGQRIAFIRSGDVTRPIEIPYADSSIGLQINARGDVTGHWTDVTGKANGFLYTAEGVLLTNEPMTASINSWGTLVGTVETFYSHAVMNPAEPDPFLEAQLAPLLRPSGARAINDAGQVVAWGRAPNDNRHQHHDAYLYSHYKLFNLTPERFFSYHLPTGKAINRWGQVVGAVAEAMHGERGSFVGVGESRAFFSSEGRTWDLNSLIDTNTNWVLTEAVAINDHGQILAYARSGRAASTAMLLNPRPKVLETRLQANAMTLVVHELPGSTLKIQSSTNLSTWTTVTTNRADTAIRAINLMYQTETAVRFYRVLNDGQYEEVFIAD